MILRICLVLFIFGLTECAEMKDHALFYRRTTSNKKVRESKKVDTMEGKSVEEILNWLQNRYKEVNRRTRNEDLSRAYLPAEFGGSTTQEPRPFQAQQSQQNGKTPSVTSYQPSPSYLAPDSHQTQPPFQPSTSYRPPSISYQDQTEYQTQQSPPQGSYIPANQVLQHDNNAINNAINNPTQQTAFPTYTQTLPQELSPAPGRHPPHIHALNVDCSKDKMRVDLEFNENFNGVVYSKGHHNNEECRHIKPGSNRNRFTFTLSQGTCGTEYIDQFSTGKKAYLENVLVIQNEPGIVEVWDTVRSVRCQWEGTIDQSIKSDLSIGSLTQEIVTFAGDTGTAKLEIQRGRGPYAYGAAGSGSLIEIGDLMTLVVTAEGDDSFELRVGECRGADGTGNSIQLTDANGCPLKEKLMAGFQYARHTQTGAALAYSFFRAFKFPDVMDLTMECNVQLCKTDCRDFCNDPNQVNEKLEPTRRRRSINSTRIEGDNLHLANTIKVFLPEDLSQTYKQTRDDRICLTKNAFFAATSGLSLICIVSVVASAFYWSKSIRK